MPIDGPVTIRELAKAAGVAPCTVTRALRNDPNTNSSTSLRIQKLAKKMGYTQNSTVSMLMAQLRNTRKSNYVATLAMVNAFPQRTMWRKCEAWVYYWQGAQAHAEARGYKLEEFWLREKDMTQQRFSQILLNRGIRGLLLWPLLRPLGHLNLPWEHFAAATVGYALTKPRLSYVAVDHYQVIAGTLHQLHKRRYQRIGLVIDRGFDGYQGGRVLSCYARYQQLQPLEPLKVDHDASAAVSDADLRHWFKTYRPDVIMVLSQKYLDRFAQIQKIIKAKVPLCSLDINNPTHQETGMHTRPEMVGAAAVDLVIEQLHSNVYGPPKIPKAVLIEGDWRPGTTA
jgi:LacI family transcriptional regulator